MNMYREEVPIVKRSGSAVIQDNGYLSSTGPGSNGNYLFSEVGAGVKAMALVGTKQEILAWLSERKNYFIENRIPDLPAIYLSVQPYRPGTRFVGLFPVHAAIQHLVEAMGALGAGAAGAAAGQVGGALTDIAGGVKDLKGAQELSRAPMKGVYSYSTTPAPDPGKLYVRFHYLQTEHASKAGEKFLSLETVAKVVALVVA
jgi:hypothetical protein